MRDSRNSFLQKFIDMIRKMDDKTFNRFIDLVINRMNQNGHTDIDNEEFINTLNLLRTKTNFNGILSDNPKGEESFYLPTDCTVNYWVPFCVIGKIWFVFYFIATVLYFYFYETCMTACYSL